jgi:uncharacterized protein YneF (UPF0154 family)
MVKGVILFLVVMALIGWIGGFFTGKRKGARK